MSLIDKIQIDLDRERYFLQKLKDRVEKNFLKNFIIFWQERNRLIDLQELLITFLW